MVVKLLKFSSSAVSNSGQATGYRRDCGLHGDQLGSVSLATDSSGTVASQQEWSITLGARCGWEASARPV
ncbi:MAG: hypothetical protein HXX08_02660 [Chloroflexi bacterium]|uniref:Uncharacterized protein n=1 Tax=Candidatus Chlorohelix allophototropha TaxID=3003348 RepID=A0A8T7LV76_9CHLR|nr:hypothetical protein [Chloroflexota bacterium]WJW66641.1 hypothetical protein OZ401_002452 [Chloroflexota bacterium L227-S17]